MVAKRPDHWFFIEKGASDLVVGHGEVAGKVGDSCEGGEGGWLADVPQVLERGDGAVGAGAGGLPTFRHVGDKGVRTGARSSHWAKENSCRMTSQVQNSSKFPNSPSEQAKVRTSKICAGRWEPFDWLRGDAHLLNALNIRVTRLTQNGK